MARKLKIVLINYSIATIGLFLVALGAALSIKSNLGTSPLSAPAYVLSETGYLSVGNWTIIINTIFMLIQAAVLRKRFKAKYLLQMAATVIFGYLIDLSLMIFDYLEPASLLSRIILIVIACFVTAVGVSLEVICKAWMLSAEMTVYAFVLTTHKEFRTLKIVMDCTVLAMAAILSFACFNNPFGSGTYEGMLPLLNGTSNGVVIGTGTFLMAVLTGAMMKITDPLTDRFMDKVFEKVSSLKP